MIALYGKKIRMTQVFDDSGSVIPVTLLQILSNVIIGLKDQNKDGYSAKILAVFDRREKHMTKSHMGQFPKNISPRKKIFEIQGFEDKKVGDSLGIDVFQNLSFVDITGYSKGRGTQGVMKRHGAHGGPARHGSKFHRSAGAIGQGGTPARFRKGSKMAGRMGNTKSTVQNLRIINIDIENSILTIAGATPGANGSAVLIRGAIKK